MASKPPPTSDSKGEKPAVRHFEADARVVLSLGRDSIKDKTTAVLELVKNSYDAGATAVEIELNAANQREAERFIRIRDNGHGMTSEDLDGRFLWIGYSAKRESPTYEGRRRIGEKGIGRLSADRLGEVLELRSQATDVAPVGVAIDWRKFDTSRQPIASIPIPEIADPTFDVPQCWPYLDGTEDYRRLESRSNSPEVTGTELTIKRLRQTWDLEEIQSLWRDLSLLTSPFRKGNDFQIRLTHDLDDEEAQGVVESSLVHAAEVEAEFNLSEAGWIQYTIRSSDSAPEVGKEKWEEFYHRAKAPEADNGKKKPPVRPLVGPLKAVLYFYLIRSTSTLSVTDVRDLLDRMAGVKVYRDGIRVMPYGDNQKEEGGDWLGLGERKTKNPAGAGRKTFRIAPKQLVGAVFISSDENPNLRDTSAREGLVHDEAFREMKAFVMGCIGRLEGHYHAAFQARKDRSAKEKSPRQAVMDFGVELRDLKADLNAVKTTLPSRAEKQIDAVAERIETAVSQITTFRHTIDELASQAIIYRGLASVGIASVVFSHETDVSLDQFQSAALATRNILRFRFTLEKVPDALKELDKAIEEAKKISAWGKFALRRVKADKRRKKTVDLGRVIIDLANDLKTVFAASSIALTYKVAECQGRAFQMDIESIVLNLLTNAYSFAKLSQKESRKVLLQARLAKSSGRDGMQIIVSDSGPGVALAIRDKIWMPLFTTKEDDKKRSIGTGLGLAIIDDIIKDNNGTRIVDDDPDLGGARFTIWIPLP